MQGTIAAFFGRTIVQLAMVALIIVLVLVVLNQCSDSRQVAVEADVTENRGDAAADSAADAIGPAGAVNGRDTASDDLTRRNGNAIDDAPGADTPVDPGVHNVGIGGLCRRAAYRDSEQCLQHPLAPGMAGSGSGRSAP